MPKMLYYTKTSRNFRQTSTAVQVLTSRTSPILKRDSSKLHQIQQNFKNIHPKFSFVILLTSTTSPKIQLCTPGSCKRPGLGQPRTNSSRPPARQTRDPPPVPPIHSFFLNLFLSTRFLLVFFCRCRSYTVLTAQSEATSSTRVEIYSVPLSRYDTAVRTNKCMHA